MIINNLISENGCIGWQDMMYNFELEYSEPNILGHFKRNAVDSFYCFLIKVCVLLCSAVGSINKLFSRRLV